MATRAEAPRGRDRPLLRPRAAELRPQDEVRPVQQPTRSAPPSRCSATQAQPDVLDEKAPVTVGDVRPGDARAGGVRRGGQQLRADRAEVRRASGPVGRPLQAAVLGLFVLGRAGQGAESGGSRTATDVVAGADDRAGGRSMSETAAAPAADARRVRRHPEPAVHELDVWLLAGETIGPTPPGCSARGRRTGTTRSPSEGCPGVAVPLDGGGGPDPSTSGRRPGTRLLFGDLPLKPGARAGRRPSSRRDPRRTPSGCCGRSSARRTAGRCRGRGGPVPAGHPGGAGRGGVASPTRCIAGYTAVLCSPEFVCLEEKPGRLDDHALAARLAFFLWNSAPDDELRRLADRGELREPGRAARADRAAARRPEVAALRRGVPRLLARPAEDRRHRRRTRRSTPTTTSTTCSPTRPLEETRLFFAELLRADLPARNVVASDFTFLNERLAAHYGLAAGRRASALRKVALPPDSLRGGLMTQASVLKVTANGTTTSPVLRGRWIMERILGKPPPPPPPGVPAVEPDIRGATTIREQLDKHRDRRDAAPPATRKIDPPGFALESFDVIGGWRDRYRAARRRRARSGVRQERPAVRVPPRPGRSTRPASCPTAGRSRTSASSSGCCSRTSGRSPATSPGSSSSTPPARRCGSATGPRSSGSSTATAARAVTASAPSSTRSCRATVPEQVGGTGDEPTDRSDSGPFVSTRRPISRRRVPPRRRRRAVAAAARRDAPGVRPRRPRPAAGRPGGCSASATTSACCRTSSSRRRPAAITRRRRT